MVKKIDSIYYWRRSSQAMNYIEGVTISYKDKSLTYQDNKRKLAFTLSDDEFKSIKKEVATLLDEKKLDPKYFAYKYEEEYFDYSLKFFVTINYLDKTYFAYKGTQPFNEAYYQEISSYFDKLINLGIEKGSSVSQFNNC